MLQKGAIALEMNLQWNKMTYLDSSKKIKPFLFQGCALLLKTLQICASTPSVI
jgi:hypothetical protein